MEDATLSFSLPVAPLSHAEEIRDYGFSKFSQAILNFRRDNRIHLPMYNPGALKITTNLSNE